VTTRVLVAEDDPTVAEVVVMYLRRDGHEVEWVADGVTALNRARASATCRQVAPARSAWSTRSCSPRCRARDH
jgi:CheY-like chemotaxis protein